MRLPYQRADRVAAKLATTSGAAGATGFYRMIASTMSFGGNARRGVARDQSSWF